MRLSVDHINEQSPYWVIQLDDMQFRFVTKNGIKYRVGFYADEYFLGDKAFHFYIDNEEKIHAPKDRNVSKVIILIIEEFFRQDSSVMLYICDPSDNREAARSNLYKHWFSNYEKKNELTLLSEELNFNGYISYAGMILRKDHPEYDSLINDYKIFIQRATTMPK